MSLCECGCGQEAGVYSKTCHVKPGQPKRFIQGHSGGGVKIVEDLTGKIFGDLTVLRRDGSKGKHAMWWCRCKCGVEKSISGGSMKNMSQYSCGCARYIRPYESLYNYCMFHAHRERPELKHTLTYEEFLSFVKKSVCHYCDAEVEFVARNINGKRAIRYNLDRKDNKKGYCANNLVVCCKVCNYTKGDRFTYEQFVQIGKVIRSFRCS